MFQNQNNLLVKHQIDNTTTPGGWGLTAGDKSGALRREVNLDTQSSDILLEEIRQVPDCLVFLEWNFFLTAPFPDHGLLSYGMD